MSKQEDEPGLGADVDQPAGNAAASDGTNVGKRRQFLLSMRLKITVFTDIFLLFITGLFSLQVALRKGETR